MPTSAGSSRSSVEHGASTGPRLLRAVSERSKSEAPRERDAASRSRRSCSLSPPRRDRRCHLQREREARVRPGALDDAGGESATLCCPLGGGSGQVRVASRAKAIAASRSASLTECGPSWIFASCGHPTAESCAVVAASCGPSHGAPRRPAWGSIGRIARHEGLVGTSYGLVGLVVSSVHRDQEGEPSPRCQADGSEVVAIATVVGQDRPRCPRHLRATPPHRVADLVDLLGIFNGRKSSSRTRSSHALPVSRSRATPNTTYPAFESTKRRPGSVTGGRWRTLFVNVTR